MDKRIYFDNAATSFPKPPCVAKAVSSYINKIGCNINRGCYGSAYGAEDTVYETRESLRRLFNGPDVRNVIFTSGVTASLNMVLRGLLKPGSHVITSSMEHNAVMRPLCALADEIMPSGAGADSRTGSGGPAGSGSQAAANGGPAGSGRQADSCRTSSFTRIPCDIYGRLDPADVEAAIRPDTKAIVMTHASNVCGTLLPLARVGSICAEHGLYFIVDAAQTAGVFDIDMQAMHIDALCFAGHKGLMGPQGIGGMVLSDRIAGEMEPLIAGGTGSFSHLETMPSVLPDKFEAGTLNLPGIYGLSSALSYISSEGMASIKEHEQQLARLFADGLAGLPGIRLLGSYGPGAPLMEASAVVSLAFDNIDASQAAFRLDSEYGIETRVGLHCAPSAHRTLGSYPSGSVRFSFGYFNTEEEVNYGIEAVRSICNGR